MNGKMSRAMAHINMVIDHEVRRTNYILLLKKLTSVNHSKPFKDNKDNII